MPAWLSGILNLIGSILGALFKSKPSAAERAGVAETKVASYEAEQKRVQAAADARFAADNGVVRRTSEEREAAARAPDPNSRD